LVRALQLLECTNQSATVSWTCCGESTIDSNGSDSSSCIIYLAPLYVNAEQYVSE